MKKIITLLFASLMLFSFSAYAQVQDKKVERKERKEQRRQEKAVRDSLMTLMQGTDSVNVGYGHVKKGKLNTSVTRLDGKKRTAATYTDIADYIQANAPGVMVQKGSRTRYIIRGIGTNSDATDPLLLVDGVEVDSFDSLLPSQVDYIDVIKDGSAAMYGARGANGVIMITTKTE